MDKSKQQIHQEAVNNALQKLKSMGYDAILSSPRPKPQDDSEKPDITISHKTSDGKDFRVTLTVKHDSSKKSSWGKLGEGVSWVMNTPADASNHLYYLVNKDAETQEERVFVLPSAIVSQYLRETKEHQSYEVNVFVLREPESDNSLEFNTPTTDDYENRFDLLRIWEK